MKHESAFLQAVMGYATQGAVMPVGIQLPNNSRASVI